MHREQKAIVEFEVEQMKKFLLSGCVPNEKLSLRKQKEIKYYIIVFSVHYHSAKNKNAVEPSTMKHYIYGIQRDFEEWGTERIYSRIQCFSYSKDDILSVLTSLFSKEQANRNVVKEHFLNKSIRETQSPCYSRFNQLWYT